MKYQFIYNDQIKFETNSVKEFIEYLVDNEISIESVLYNVLNEVGSYKSKWMSASYHIANSNKS